MESEIGVFLLDENGHLIGVPDDTNLKNAPWPKRVLAKISKRYRRRFITLRPFSAPEEVTKEFRGKKSKKNVVG